MSLSRGSLLKNVSFERLILALLVVACAGLLVDRGAVFDRPAGGSPVAEDAPMLGPASGLLLKGDRGERGDLTLRSSDGRLSWGKGPYPKAYTVGFVHITKPLRKLRERPSIQEEVDALVQSLSEKDGEYQKRLEEISTRLRDLQEGTDEYRRLFGEGEALFREYRAWQVDAVERRNRMEAKHLETSYRQLVDAVDVVADRLGVDIVYRFIPTSDPFEATEMSGAFNEIRFRSVLRYPQELDITPEVLKELGFDAD